MGSIRVVGVVGLGCLLLVQSVVAHQAEVAERKATQLEARIVEEGRAMRPAPDERLAKPNVQAVDPTGEAPLDDAITCLARAIYWEARGERVEDMEAVANVVMNRLAHPGFPATTCGVVREGGEQGPCQFSWWCDGRGDTADEEDAYALAKEIARQALNRQFPDRTGGALYFHHETVAPDWARHYTKTVQVGEFAFYRPQNGDAR